MTGAFTEHRIYLRISPLPDLLTALLPGHPFQYKGQPHLRGCNRSDNRQAVAVNAVTASLSAPIHFHSLLILRQITSTRAIFIR